MEGVSLGFGSATKNFPRTFDSVNTRRAGEIPLRLDAVAAHVRVRTYVYDGETAAPHVAAVLERLSNRDESIDYLNLAAAGDRDAALREAMLTVRESVRIGTNPDGIYDDEGEPDFSAGVLVTQEPTGRRRLHVGAAALEALADEADDGSADG